jgi:ABC-type multidrug transport system fused ATPase/permease subunit
MDDSLSFVDAKTEEIQAALESESARTTLIIAQRFSTIRRLTRFWFLRTGPLQSLEHTMSHRRCLQEGL